MNAAYSLRFVSHQFETPFVKPITEEEKEAFIYQAQRFCYDLDAYETLNEWFGFKETFTEPQNEDIDVADHQYDFLYIDMTVNVKGKQTTFSYAVDLTGYNTPILDIDLDEDVPSYVPTYL